MFLWLPSTKIVQAIIIRKKKNMVATGVGGGWGQCLFPLYIYIEKKKSCQKLPDQFQYYLSEVFL